MEKILKSVSTLLMIIFCLPSYVANARTDAMFLDIETNTYRDAIEIITREGLVKGYDDGMFRPDQEVNRAELMKMITPVNKRDGLNSSCSEFGSFSDVNSSQWFAEYVCYGLENNYIKGYPDGSFKPGQPVIFVEALKIIMNSQGFEYKEEGDTWFEWSVRSAIQMNILPYVSSFSQPMTRAQIAEIIVRSQKYKDGTLGDFLDSYEAGEKLDYSNLTSEYYPPWNPISSTDEWVLSYDTETFKTIFDLEALEVDGKEVLLALDADSSGSKTGLYKSVDGGKTWSAILLNDNEKIDSYDFRENTKTIVVCGTDYDKNDGFIYRSDDFGETWDKIFTVGDVQLYRIIIDKDDSQKIYSVSRPKTSDTAETIIFGSTDGGESFARSTIGDKIVDSVIPWVFKQDKFTGDLYLTGESHININEKRNGDYYPPLLKSDDNGLSWVNIFENNNWHFINADFSQNMAVFAQESYKIFEANKRNFDFQEVNLSFIPYYVAVDPYDENKVIVGGLYGDLGFVTNGKFLDFSALPDKANAVIGLDFSPDGKKLYVSYNNDGLYVFERAH